MANQIKYQVGFDVQKQGLNDLKSSLQQLQKMKLSDIMKINNTDITSARQTFKKISDDAKMVENALEKAFNPKLNTVNVERFKESLKGMNLTGLYDSFSKAGAAGESAFRNLTTQVLGTNTTLKQSHALLDKMATTLSNTIKWHAASAAINGVSRSVQQAWGYVKHLDGSLNDIRIVTGKSAEQMGKFAQQANEAAKSLGKTTTDYTDAALIFAQQGLSDKEIEERAKITLKTANVTGQSTNDVSEELTAVWNGYKVNAEQAQLYVDRLAAVAATTASNLEELSTGMSKVAAAANAMGVGEDQLAAQLSTIISVTKQAPESVGTALRTVYARISDIKAGIDQDGVTLGKYSGDMAELGFNVLDVNGKLRDMGQVMEQIGNGWSNLTREQQVHLAQTMAGQRQYSNLIALFDNFQQYNKALNTAQNAAGTLQKQQDIYMESTAAHLNQLKAATQDVYDSLINTDSVNELIDIFTKLTEGIASFVDSIGGGGQLLQSLGAIAITVFSQQISQGLLTTINNFKMANQQAELLKVKIKQAEQLQQSGKGNASTQRVISQQKNLLGMTNQLSPEEINQMQQAIEQYAQAAGDFEQAQEKLNKFKTALEQVGITEEQTIKQFGSFDNMLQTTAGVDFITEKLQNFEKQAKPTKEALEQLKQSWNTFSQDTKNVSNFSNFGNELTKTLNIIKSSDGIFESLSEGSQQTVEKVQNDLKNIDFNIASNQNIQAAQGAYQQLRNVITNELAEIERQLKLAERGEIQFTTEQVKQLQIQKNAYEQALNVRKKGLQQSASIKQFVQVTGAIGQMSMALQQFQNLGSIWKNQDLSTGEKLLQTITNLSFSLPMLIKGFQTLNVTFGLVAKAQGTAALAGQVHTGSLISVGTAAEGAAGKILLFNGALAVNPIFAIITALAGLITVLGLVNNASKQATQNAIDEAREIIDQENEIQDQIDSHKELYSSLQELNKQYETHQISRSELKNSIDDLISQYDLEQESIDKLTGSYKNLSQVITQLKLDQANEKGASLERQRINAKKQLENTMKKEMSANQIDFGAANKTNSDISVVQELMKKGIGNRATNGQYLIDFGENPEQWLQSYEEINKALQDISLTQKDLDDSQVYHNLVSEINKVSEALEHYKTVQDQIKDNQIEKTGLQAIQNQEIDPSAIQSLSAYADQYDKLIEIMGGGSEGKRKAEQFLKNNFAEVYDKYNEAASLIDNIQKRIGGSEQQISTIQKAIESMGDDRFTALIDQIGIKGTAITDWKTLYDIIQSISSIDLSNLNTIQGEESLTSLKEAAADKYNIYQSLQDQVQGGKSISKSEYKNLQPEVQEFFSMMANGSYKMTGDAKTFYETVNSLKLDGFIQAVGAANSQLQKIKNIQSFLDTQKDSIITGQSKDFDYEAYNKTAQTTRVNKAELDPGASSGFALSAENQELLRTQLDYLDAVSASGTALDKLVQGWKRAAEQGTLNKDIIKQIGEQYEKAGDQTDKLKEKEQKLTEQAEELQRQLRNAMDPIDDDIAEQAVKKLADRIQEASESSKDFSKDLKDDSQAAEEIAEAILRFGDAAEDVQKNFEDWSDTLKDSGDNMAAFSSIADDLADAYGDLLNIDGSKLSDTFLKSADNLNLMKQATEGNIDAYDQLADRAAQDILIHLENDGNDVLNELADEYTTLKEFMENEEIKVGQNIDKSNIIEACQSIADQAFAMTGDVQQAMALANAAFSSLGYDVQMNTKTEESTDPVEDTEITKTTTVHDIYESLPTYTTEKSADKQWARINGTHGASGQVVSVDTVLSPIKSESTKNTTATGIEVTRVGKGATGAVKSNNSTHKTKGKSGGGGKKGGGGNKGRSKKSSPTKLTSASGSKMNASKSTMEKVSGLKDPYYLINRKLEQQERLLKGISKQADKAFGQERIKLLKEQSTQLEKQNKLLKDKQKIQQEELKNQREALTKMGAKFDTSGNIQNYSSLIDTKTNTVNAAIDTFNTADTTYTTAAKKHDAQVQAQKDLEKKYARYKKLKNIAKNKRTPKQKKELKDLKTWLENVLGKGKINDNRYNTIMKKYQNKEKTLKNDAETKKEARQAAEQAVDKAKDTLDDLQDKIKDYTDTQDLGYELGEELEENLNLQYELKIQAFNSQIELKLNMKQAERDWNEFIRNIKNADDILKDSNFDKLKKNLELNLVNLTSYTGKDGDLISQINYLKNLQKEIQDIANTGTSKTYGDNMAKAMEDYQKGFDNIKQQWQNIQNYTTAIQQGYLETIQNVSSQLDQQIDKYNFINDLINHSINSLQLIYGEKNYAAMQNYYQTLSANQFQQIELLKNESQIWWDEWHKAAENGETQAAKIFEEKYRETFNNLNSMLEQQIQTIQDKYINAINKIFDQLDKKITDGLGIDYIELDWNLTNENNEGILDTIEAAYAIDDLETRFQKLLDNTKSFKNQQNIKKVMDEQLNILKSKEKVTEYDIKRAEQLLQIEQARAALDDAQSAKTELRLKRDAQGNYSYEYTANRQQTQNREQEFLKAQHELYKIDKEQYESNLDAMLNAWKNFQAEYIEIITDRNLTEEEQNRRRQLLEEKYGERINQIAKKNIELRNNTMNSGLTELGILYETTFDNLSEIEKQSMMKDILPTWENGIKNMIDKITEKGGFTEVIKDSFLEISKVTTDYSQQVEKAYEVAGQSLKDLKDGINDTATAYNTFNGVNEILIKTMKDNLGTVKSFVDTVSELMNTLKAGDTSIENLQKVYNLIQKISSADYQQGLRQKQEEQRKKQAEEQAIHKARQAQEEAAAREAERKRQQQIKNQQKAELQRRANDILAEINAMKKVQSSSKKGSAVGVAAIAGSSFTTLQQQYNDIMKQIASLDQGGYTGQWNNSKGKLAILHEKELVLNKNDTKNLLNSISILKTFSTSLDNNLGYKMQSFRNKIIKTDNDNGILQQQVHIEASFPNVNSKRQIEEAFNDLVNLAAQRAMRK